MAAGRGSLSTTGDLNLKMPKLRQGSFFPSLLERRRRVDRVLSKVVIEAYPAWHIVAEGRRMTSSKASSWPPRSRIPKCPRSAHHRSGLPGVGVAIGLATGARQ